MTNLVTESEKSNCPNCPNLPTPLQKSKKNEVLRIGGNRIVRGHRDNWGQLKLNICRINDLSQKTWSKKLPHFTYFILYLYLYDYFVDTYIVVFL